MFNKKFLKHYYIMLIPAFVWLIFFNIVPMFGIVMAISTRGLGCGSLPWWGLRIFSTCSR